MNRINLDILTRTAYTASAFSLLMLRPSTALAEAPSYTGNPIADGILSTVVYSVIGIIMAFVSYKVIDLLTPGELSKDIAENNIALAILVGCTVLGISIIIAASIAG